MWGNTSLTALFCFLNQKSKTADSEAKKVFYFWNSFLFIVLFLVLGFYQNLNAQLTLKTGSYAGDGLDDRQITGLGFQPDIVIIKRNGTSTSQFRTSTMTGDVTKPIPGPADLKPDRIQSLDADGFTIGGHTSVNNIGGDTYHWLALQTLAGVVEVGSYTGDGTDNRAITLGFQPDFVIILGDNDQESCHRHSALTGDKSYVFDGSPVDANKIQAFVITGFEIGSDLSVNESGKTFHYMAFRASAGMVAIGNYAGDGADNRSIAGTGFLPDYVFVRADGGQLPLHRVSSMSGDVSMYFTGNPNDPNYIQAFESDGFQVGDDNRVNGSAYNYYWIAFVGQGALPVQLLSFHANVLSTQEVSLKWTTAYEFNLYDFEVERSQDGKMWTFVYALPATNSNGKNAQNYEAIDKPPFSGTYFYRLKSIDLDSRSYYSQVIEISVQVNSKIFCVSDNYPNPCKDKTRVNLILPEDGYVVCTIYNLTGQKVWEFSEMRRAGENILDITVSALHSGTYFYRLSFYNKSFTQKLVVMKD